MTLRAVREALLAERHLAVPDGRPLYGYRFSRAEYESMRAALRAGGPEGFRSGDGCALFLAFAAEWFRRDRAGGHWDWIRPLAEIGIRYHSQDPSGDLTYSQVRAAIETGLSSWRRSHPVDRDWVLAVVREAGFPAAATRIDQRLSIWLKRSVIVIERGFSPRNAVEIEGWRASERIVRALFDSAVALCTAVAELRASIPLAERNIDPVSWLDARRVGWRAELPFDLEARDIAALVEEVLRVRADQSDALWTGRRIVRRGTSWQARITLSLSGEIDHGRMPAGLSDRLSSLGRLRLVARGELDMARPFAALERDRTEDHDVWEVRPLVTAFDRALPLNADVRLGALSGDHVVGEFTAFGGEALDTGVVVLEPSAGESPEAATTLAVLGAGPVRSRAGWLALAVAPELLSQVIFEARLADLGAIEGDGLAVVAFRGEASLELNGVRRVWRSGCDDERRGRLVLVGELLRGVREQVYLGVPRLLVAEAGLSIAPSLDRICWRPHDHGAWQPLVGAAPTGRLDLGLIESGKVVDSITLAIAPLNLRFRARVQPRSLRIDGLGGARAAARDSFGPLPIVASDDDAIVDLERLAPGTRLVLELQAQGRLDLTLDDPSSSEVLVTPNNQIAARRSRLTIGRLQGYRLLAAKGGRLRFELGPQASRTSHFTRAVDGSVPLGAFDDDIRSLLGGSDNLDVDVHLSWLGKADRAAEIGWYGRIERRGDVVSAEAPAKRTAFALLRPSEASLEDAPAATAAGTPATLRAALGPGPWLIHAVGGDGEVLRPRLVRDASFTSNEPLAAAIAVTLQADRSRAFDALLTTGGDPDTALRRWFVDMLVLARRVGLPLSALDGATALCRTPEAAVQVLATCDSLEERAAVLALQRDLSFLWCTTPLPVWLDAFSARRNVLMAHLSNYGIDRSEALRHILNGLTEIADLLPGAAAHVRLVFLLEVHGQMPSDRPPLDPALARRLSRGTQIGAPTEVLRSLAGELVARRVDVDLPPRDLHLAGVVPDGAGVLNEINPTFRDVAAAPYVAAALATGLADPSHSLRRRCREAWLYDPDYFENAAAIALSRLAGNAAAPAMEIVR